MRQSVVLNRAPPKEEPTPAYESTAQPQARTPSAVKIGGGAAAVAGATLLIKDEPEAKKKLDELPDSPRADLSDEESSPPINATNRMASVKANSMPQGKSVVTSPSKIAESAPPESSRRARMESLAKPKTNVAHQGNVRIFLEPIVATKQLTPTRLSLIESSLIEVEVSDGLTHQKSGFFSKTQYLSYRVRVKHIRSEVRRQDKAFDEL